MRSLTYYDGSYFGQVNDRNEPHGFGYLNFDDNVSYCGTFYNGVEHGSGTMTTADGNTYTANFIQGTKLKYTQIQIITYNTYTTQCYS